MCARGLLLGRPNVVSCCSEGVSSMMDRLKTVLFHGIELRRGEKEYFHGIELRRDEKEH